MRPIGEQNERSISRRKSTIRTESALTSLWVRNRRWLSVVAIVVLILASVESLLRFFYAEAFYVSRRAPGQPHGTEAIGNSYLICFVLFALISVVLIYWRRRRNDDPRSRLLLLATSVFLDILGIGVALSFVFIIQYVQVKLLHH